MAIPKKLHNQPFVKAVTSILYLRLGSRFVAPINAALNVSEKAFDDSIWNTWQDVTSLARQIPHSQQEKLVDFVNELMKQPVAVTGQEQLKQKGGWKRLPGLGMEMRESWNSYKLTAANLIFCIKYGQDLAPQGKKRLDESWVNLNAFAARLTSFASAEGETRDFSLFAIWTMREALEDNDLPEKKTLPNLRVFQAAAVWMIYCGTTLKERAEKNQTFDGKMAKEGKNLEGKGWRGFSEARWQVWIERLRLAKERCQDEKTRELLGKVISE